MSTVGGSPLAGGRLLVILKVIMFAAALIPLGKLVYEGLNDGLGANPIEKITHVTGWWALSFLLLSLSITPLRRITGWSWWMRLRRMLGLYAFFYAGLHFLTYLVLDQFFDWPAIVKDIAKRPYITVGFPAFMLMIPLAITSTDAMIRRLGGKRWRLLHRLIYPIAVGGVVHFWWLVKKDIREPALFAALLAGLLIIRAGYWLRGRMRRNLPAGAMNAAPAHRTDG
ncbi:sulfite oxidase heme-binding subunit YedZ [Methylococcus sp. EFPC2]|uniref:sulfite oxidase heme-binding subunit YedZ n=1 Tax=Methylococcus sp. EFPC2 TaxID=2812648 RepID=UPI0019671F37|nr:protein-methionine-sulfoxide reductase heme-binding subunit MsrQ [Methylococcus sp. EFPC2]QSA95781.1 sulfoxide reductase heme-binding subunit YedZ [Methylococcus sp. EFPC2]